MTPRGKVPVIDDDGFVLFERNNAIIRYLAAKREWPLYPGGAKQRALVDQWADFVSDHIASALGRGSCSTWSLRTSSWVRR